MDGVQAVIDLHKRLQAWMGAGDKHALLRFQAALADDFTIISPDGRLHSRAEIVAALSGMKPIGDDFTIRIDDASSRSFGDSVVAVVYREVQDSAARGHSDRWSSALLTKNSDGRFVWRRLHECWAG